MQSPGPRLKKVLSPWTIEKHFSLLSQSRHLNLLFNITLDVPWDLRVVFFFLPITYNNTYNSVLEGGERIMTAERNG